MKNILNDSPALVNPGISPTATTEPPPAEPVPVVTTLADLAASFEALRDGPVGIKNPFDPNALAAWALVRCSQHTNEGGAAALAAAGFVLGHVAEETRSPLTAAVAWPDDYLSHFVAAMGVLSPSDISVISGRFAMTVIGQTMSRAADAARGILKDLPGVPVPTDKESFCAAITAAHAKLNEVAS